MAGNPRAARPSELVATCDQWVRATHVDTAVDGAGGELSLSWIEPRPADAEGEVAEPCSARGLATDRLCRIYRIWRRGVSRQQVGPTVDGLDYASVPDPIPLVGTPTDAPGNDKSPVAGPDFVSRPTDSVIDGVGIAIDHADRLFIADAGAGHVAVLDLWSRRLLRTVAVATPKDPDRTPAGLATDGEHVLVVVQEPPGLLSMTATSGPVEIELPSGAAQLDGDAVPSRVAVLGDGTPVVLFHTPSGDGWLVAGGRGPINVGPASDIAVDLAGNVVIAPCPSGERTFLRRVTPSANDWIRTTPLDASGYGGSGLVVTRDGRIGYYTADGFRLAVAGAVTYATDGHCITYRLDSGTPLNQWGRVFIEACVPDGTSVLVGAMTSDDEFETEIGHTPADPSACTPADLDQSPPLPPSLLAGSDPAAAARLLHRRTTSPVPWVATDDHFVTLEAPIAAPPGRFLWLTIRLRGNSRRTPRVSEVRIERHAHTLLKRLPAIYSDDQERGDFLHRYLATFDGMLHDLEIRSRCRDILIDPHGTPAEALGWLASFFGLALDDRWAEAARRQLVEEIVPLYRRRGTLWSIGRYIEIFLAGEHAGDPYRRTPSPVLLEHFRLRGLGGPLVGDDPVVSSRSVVGHGFRVGGAVDRQSRSPLDPDVDPATAFDTTAHRFSVLIPRSLGFEEEAAIRHILDTERPAHTTYVLCTVDAGARVGLALHLEISSIIGATGGFEGAVSDLSLLGRGALLGGPTTGIAVEAARVGHTARVG